MCPLSSFAASFSLFLSLPSLPFLLVSRPDPRDLELDRLRDLASKVPELDSLNSSEASPLVAAEVGAALRSRYSESPGELLERLVEPPPDLEEVEPFD